MKKLYIKQKVFKITDHYPIFDEYQNEVYRVDQDFKLIGNTVHVSDTMGREIFTVNKEVFALLPRYVVSFSNGQEIVLKSRFTLFKKAIDVEMNGMNLLLEGDFFDHNFDLLDGHSIIGSIRKEFLSWGDTFELTINNEKHQDLIVAIMIAVDCIKDNESKN